jgi:hypothetical protein
MTAAYGDLPNGTAAGGGFTREQDGVLTHHCRRDVPPGEIVASLGRIALRWERRPSELVRRIEWLLGPAALAVGRATPTDQALLSLFGRAREDRSTDGGFRLDGRPATAKQVVMAANALRSLMGLPAIPYPGLGGDR